LFGSHEFVRSFGGALLAFHGLRQAPQNLRLAEGWSSGATGEFQAMGFALQLQLTARQPPINAFGAEMACRRMSSRTPDERSDNSGVSPLAVSARCRHLSRPLLAVALAERTCVAAVTIFLRAEAVA
jgi:hypothetical protein